MKKACPMLLSLLYMRCHWSWKFTPLGISLCWVFLKRTKASKFCEMNLSVQLKIISKLSLILYLKSYAIWFQSPLSMDFSSRLRASVTSPLSFFRTKSMVRSRLQNESESSGVVLQWHTQLWLVILVFLYCFVTHIIIIQVVGATILPLVTSKMSFEGWWCWPNRTATPSALLDASVFITPVISRVAPVFSCPKTGVQMDCWHCPCLWQCEFYCGEIFWLHFWHFWALLFANCSAGWNVILVIVTLFGPHRSSNCMYHLLESKNMGGLVLPSERTLSVVQCQEKGFCALSTQKPRLFPCDVPWAICSNSNWYC